MSDLPDLGRASTLDDFAETLRGLKTWAGNPSFETITARVNARRAVVEQVGKTTVVDCFRAGRRRLDAELVAAVVEALHPDPGYVSQWQQALRVISGETQAAAQVRVLDALPPDLPTFTGRSAELDRLRDLARTGQAVVISALAGMAGVGKTQLAVHVGHVLHEEEPFERILFVNLRGFHPDPAQPPADPAAVLDGFLRQLGVSGHQVPHPVEARAELFRRKLTGLRSLVVLDNASDEKQVAPLLPDLPGCVTLVTSRRNLGALDPVSRFAVDVFSEAEALRYLAAAVPRIPVGSDPQAAARIARRCGHLPLALALVTGHMRAKPGWTLTDHADWLDERHENRRLDSEIELALEVSYRNLPAGGREFLRVIAQHPGQDFDARAAAALAGTDLPTAEVRLRELASDNLVQSAATGRYQLHDLVRDYAAARSADEDRRADRDAAMTRLLEHYLATTAAAMDRLDPAGRTLRPEIPPPDLPLPDLGEPLTWLEAERHNLIASVTYAAAAARAGHATRMAVVLSRYLQGRYNTAALLVHEAAARVAREAGDEVGYAGALTNAANAEIFLGRHDAAARRLENALRILGRHDRPVDTARVLNNLGIANARRGLYQEALDFSQQSLDRYRLLGDRTGQARALINLGNLAGRREQPDAAVEHYREALLAYRETGDRNGEALALGNLGGAEMKRERYDSAENYLIRVLEINRELRRPNIEANALDDLGLLSTRRGDGDRAADYHRQSLKIYRDLGDRAGEACARNGLGETARARGRFEEARDEHLRALEIAADPDVDERSEQARAHTGLAEACRGLGAVAEAREHYLVAEGLWTKLGSPRAAEITEALASLGG
ncbi:tetratricopeptide repeat protein [Actinoplanes sp. NPDC051411]|uniref:tetratricopeptide repeat protein n=1 Tax=Actinoplanes sp. NPDC051411 TaxID=3155522 RepID=UPI00342540D7